MRRPGRAAPKIDDADTNIRAPASRTAGSVSPADAPVDLDRHPVRQQAAQALHRPGRVAGRNDWPANPGSIASTFT